jgi:putative nucleotidyltransferase with HDIG domain
MRKEARPLTLEKHPLKSTQGARHVGLLLVEENLISQQSLDRALATQQKQQGNLVDILIAQGDLDYRTFAQFLDRQKRQASIELSRYELRPEVIALVPAAFALAHELVPIDRLGSVLTVGVVRPLSSDVEEELCTLTGLSVKALLCAPGDVRSAIKRYYSADAQAVGEETDADAANLESPLRLSGVVQVLRRLDSLPTLPTTVQRVREMLDDPLAGAGDVAKVISNDPPIAAKLLSVANSAAYGLRNHVDTVGLAVTVLGLKETYGLVLCASVIDLFRDNKFFDFRSFWFESVCCANIATALARRHAKEKRSGIFSAGLLHDIGRLALSQVAPEHYGQVDRNLRGPQLTQAEEQFIGITHTEAGYQLAKQWGLPPDIAEAIRFHHAPAYAQESRELVAMVAIADAVAISQRPGSEDRTPDFTSCQDSLDVLCISEQDVIEILTKDQGREDADAFISPN